jgi:hypothetical protein
MRKLILIGVTIGLLLAAAIVFSASQFTWILAKTGGVFSVDQIGKAQVDSRCDGPHKVYVVRGAEGSSTSVGIFVLENGCVERRLQAEATK